MRAIIGTIDLRRFRRTKLGREEWALWLQRCGVTGPVHGEDGGDGQNSGTAAVAANKFLTGAIATKEATENPLARRWLEKLLRSNESSGSAIIATDSTARPPTRCVERRRDRVGEDLDSAHRQALR